MAKRRDIGSELTPEDFIESRQDDSDSPNPVLDIIRNVDTARDADGTDSEGMSGGASSALTATSSEAEWDSAQTAEKTATPPRRPLRKGPLHLPTVPLTTTTNPNGNPRPRPWKCWTTPSACTCARLAGSAC